MLLFQRAALPISKLYKRYDRNQQKKPKKKISNTNNNINNNNTKNENKLNNNNNKVKHFLIETCKIKEETQ